MTKLSIMPGGVALVLTGEADAPGRVRALTREAGFAGAVLLRAVGPFRKTIAYVQWTNAEQAAAEGHGPPLRAVDVRQRASPLDRGGTVPLARDGVVLALRWEVDPTQADALLAELQHFTDAYFPTSTGILSTAFHVSSDRTIVAEYLQADSVWTMLRIQLDRDMRRHQRLVSKLVRSADMGLYRVLSLTSGKDADELRR